MRVFIPLLGFFAVLAGSFVTTAAETTEFLQAPTRQSGTVLHSSRGRASLEGRDGSIRRIPLRQQEKLTTLSETASGVVMAGTRDKRWGRDLVVLESNGSSIKRLPSPGSNQNSFSVNPSLLAKQTGLAGIAWLEGPDLESLSVRVSNWSGDAWTDSHEIPTATKGAQTGLTGSLFFDDRTLLVWAAFDGHDDDIFWSIGSGQDWTQPKRLTVNNHTPDVMPSLISVDGSTVVAWNQLQGGEYRVKISHFNGSSWSNPRTLGPAGAVRPQLSAHKGQIRIVYRRAWPQSWTVAELDHHGRPLRRAQFAVTTALQPIIANSNGGTVTMRWPVETVAEASWERVP